MPVTQDLKTFQNQQKLQLSDQEAITLDRCEAVIKSGLEKFHEVGRALLTVREGELYRAEYKTFEEYCERRWSMSRNYGTRLMNAAQVMANLSEAQSVPIGTVDNGSVSTINHQPSTINGPLPATESQTRPLTQLPKEQQPEAWAEVQKRSAETNQPITAAAVQAVVQERAPKPPPTIEIPPDVPCPPAGSILNSGAGVRHRIISSDPDGSMVIAMISPTKGEPHTAHWSQTWATKWKIEPPAAAAPEEEEVVEVAPPAYPSDYIEVRVMHNTLLQAFEGDGAIQTSGNDTVDYWANKLRDLRDKLRDLEAALSRSPALPLSPSLPAVRPGLRLVSRTEQGRTYTVKSMAPGGSWNVFSDQSKRMYPVTAEELWQRFQPLEAKPSTINHQPSTLSNPFSCGMGAWTDERTRLEKVKTFDLPQLRAALLVHGLQGTVRFQIEKRIKKLEKANA